MNMGKFFHQIHVPNPTFKKINLSKANSNMSKQLKYKFLFKTSNLEIMLCVYIDMIYTHNIYVVCICTHKIPN